MDPASSVLSGCYLFKNRLFEYTQRLGIQAPLYDNIKEGPAHELSFKSTVTVDNIRYDSLPGFSSRKSAEQSAAEIALRELAKSRDKNESIHPALQESGLCKQMLQQYSRKMSYQLPSYASQLNVTQEKSDFTCTVHIGGNQYTGAAARSKKAAEINAAKAALLAIQSNRKCSEATLDENSQYVVIPCKKKRTNVVRTHNKTTCLKPKMAPMKRKSVSKSPDHVVDKLYTLSVASTQNSAGSHVKHSGVAVGNEDGYVGQNLGLQANDSGKSGVVVACEDSNIKCDGNVVLPGDNGNTSQQGAAAADTTSDVNLESPPTFKIVSEFQIKDLLSFAEEIRALCKAGVVAPTTKASSSDTTTQVHL